MKDICIFENETLINAMKKLDMTAEKVLLVVNSENQLIGTLSDGDIRRALIAGLRIDDSVITGIFNRTPLFLIDHEDMQRAKDIMLESRTTLLPIVNDNNNVIDFITWKKVFNGKKQELDVLKSTALKDFNVVIMAGGKGTRMAPFTNVMPKPLIPIKDHTILEEIIEEFTVYGVQNFFLTLNYKGSIIQAYLDSIERKYITRYIWESDFMGTAGSISLIPEEKLSDCFIVTNCDIIVKADYSDVMSFHKKSNAIITILSSIQHYQIPYGVIDFGQGGEVKDIHEKPEYTFPINTGVYILDKACLRYIPKKEKYNMTDLIHDLKKDNQKVITYPVNEKDYIDIGQWDEYKKVIETIL